VKKKVVRVTTNNSFSLLLHLIFLKEKGRMEIEIGLVILKLVKEIVGEK